MSKRLRPGRKPNVTRREQVVAMYHNGMSLRLIAAELGVTYQAVHAMLRRSGVEMRPQGGNTGSHSRHRK